MDGKQLKNSILQWAIQGKIVPQNPKDEPASKLLERIAASRNEGTLSLPKGAKSKKSAPASRIYRENGVWYEQIGNAEPKDISDDIPFEIPENWAWCRLKDYLDVRDGTHDSPKYYSTGIPFVTSKNLVNGMIDFSDVKYISQEDHNLFSTRSKVDDNDILFAMIGSIGNPVLVKKTCDFSIKNVALFKPYNEETNMHYMLLYFQFIQTGLKKIAAGGVQSFISLNVFRNWLFPLPPLAEQKRIVAKLEQVLPLADEYGAAQEQLDKLNKELPEALKKSILQQAIQGKLVPQNPKDEPAQKLLERITAARNETNQPKGTKSKKSAPTSRIYCENGTWYEQIGNAEPKDISEDIPFEIPENWTWCRWGDLSDSIQYGYNAPALESGRIKMVRISDIHDNKIEWDNVPYCQIKETEIPTYLLKKNDILFARTGGTVGKSYLVGDVPTKAVYAGYLIRTRYNAELLNPQYLKFFMESSLYWEQLHEGTIATAQPNCNGKTLGKMLLPLPPLAEQKRIVTKLEQLFKTL